VSIDAPYCPLRWLVIGPDHPALAGHFPGRPVVPGVVLLDLAFGLARDAFDPQAVLGGIRIAKFVRPLSPGEPLLIGLERIPAMEVRFVCRSGGNMIAHGTFAVASPP